jgi:hypothetical protein
MQHGSLCAAASIDGLKEALLLKIAENALKIAKSPMSQTVRFAGSLPMAGQSHSRSVNLNPLPLVEVDESRSR